jgi:ABC-type polysaccharide/polyol phosphate transport system ATPase subunit
MMETQLDLQFEGVSKRYRIPPDQAGPGPAGWWRRFWRRGTADFWAVREVSFAVPRGEALGIIGHNGAGKSTILKLLSGITTPTAGAITIRGRLAALIEVGSGFHPELTGRENIYLNGSILGMRRREISAKLDSIVDFAGVRPFIDVPVKRYSSGMYVRLGFSIAAHLDPDILLLDEVLAVGDAGFQAKCLERIRQLERAGTTIIFISHDLQAVEQLCDRVLLLHQGQIIAAGAPAEVIARYRQLNVQAVGQAPPPEPERLTQRATITALRLLDAQGRTQTRFRTGAPLTLQLAYQAHAPVPDAVLSVFFYNEAAQLQCQFTSQIEAAPLALTPGQYAYEFHCAALGLQPGIYYLDASIERQGDAELLDWQYRCAQLQVSPGIAVRGQFFTPHQARRLPQAELEQLLCP